MITAATDVNRVPAIDVLAKEINLLIENPRAIKTVNMALLKGEKIFVHDPFGFLRNSLPRIESATFDATTRHLKEDDRVKEVESISGIYVDDVIVDIPPEVLVLRLASLGDLHTAEVDMQTTVFIGNSTSSQYMDFMYTTRGYAKKYEIQS